MLLCCNGNILYIKEVYMKIKKYFKQIVWVILCCFCFLAAGCTSSADVLPDVTEEKITEVVSDVTEEKTTEAVSDETEAVIAEDGAYTSKEDVALYLHTYGKLPSNFITKKEAKALGWSGGGLDSYAYGACIGGDKFGNYEGNLPEESGRQYYECDIDTMNQDSRGAKRIVYSNDGLIYYTEDHYNTFELLYGE